MGDRLTQEPFPCAHGNIAVRLIPMANDIWGKWHDCKRQVEIERDMLDDAGDNNGEGQPARKKKQYLNLFICWITIEARKRRWSMVSPAWGWDRADWEIVMSYKRRSALPKPQCCDEHGYALTVRSVMVGPFVLPSVVPLPSETSPLLSSSLASPPNDDDNVSNITTLSGLCIGCLGRSGRDACCLLGSSYAVVNECIRDNMVLLE